MEAPQSWFIYKLPDGSCEISQAAKRETVERSWGPFADQQTAIARRVGLIRSGHCKPRT
ncbi:hypothetical protein [Gloeobacter kilaueensis]|uniref:DDE transposase family protein n=1 Tax=Gloeobacter kilaueensis (strain ATCC BAA-2537 / CCAP 1431/1 / ULC 316 / JS1) TaxID=1183438 RepID=U5QD77_GLOK1|nr:hypothetical protein [Gloeobacter kilaueensis]AGY56816.1 hypothetical protein GKIL_0570 [Gloeobacter kilaueensis JS1]